MKGIKSTMAVMYTVATTFIITIVMIIVSRRALAVAGGIGDAGRVIGINATVRACFIPLVVLVVVHRLALVLSRMLITYFVNMHHGWRLSDFDLIVVVLLLHWLVVPSHDDCSTLGCFRSRCPSASRFCNALYISMSFSCPAS
jgi:hypothetical protein